MEKLDCKGQACPLPVVNAKKALAGMGEGALEVVVDNKTAMHNLENLGKSLKVETASEERGDAEFAVVFTKGAQVADAACEECSRSCRQVARWSCCRASSWAQATMNLAPRS